MTTPSKDPYDDFRNWLFVVWAYLQLPTPTPIQYDMAVWLQRGPERSILSAFRGVGKSFVTVAYVTWLLRRDPNHKIMVVSASKVHADSFTAFVKRLIREMPELAHLQARPGQRDTAIEFDVGPAKADKSPSVKSVGIFGQLTGSRADTIIADDIEVPNTAETQGQREKLAERVKEFDAILKPGGRVVYLGTPQTEMTLYALLEGRGYETRIWPARVPSEKQVEAYGDRLAPLIRKMTLTVPRNSTTEPRRFTDEDLAKREISYGKAGFQLQFMLDPTLADVDRYPLKLADLVVLACNSDIAPNRVVWASGPDQRIPDLPNVGLKGDHWHAPMLVSRDEKEWGPYRSTVLAIDPAGRGADEASYAGLSGLGANLFLRAVGGFSHGYAPESLEGFCKVAKAINANVIRVESNFGDGMFTELLKPHVRRLCPGIGVEEVRHNRQKELRIIDTLEPLLSSHRLIVDPQVIRDDYTSAERYPMETRSRYRLFHQLTRITRERGALGQDGRLDALAMAVSFFQDKISLDQDEEAAKAREEALEKELADFLQGITGRAPTGPLWVRV